MNSKIKLLISGYNGYIGKCFIRYLKKKKINFQKLDLKQKKNYKNFTHLLHLQFYIEDKKVNLKKNIFMMKKIINICHKHRLFLIFPSTASFSSKKSTKKIKKLKVFNYYTMAKNECEKMILFYNKNFNINYTILRIFNVYGDNYKNRYLISKMISSFKSVKKYQKLKIKFSDNVRDYIYISDLNSLILKVMKKKYNGIFEAGSGKSITIKNLSKKMNYIFNKRNILEYIEPKKSIINFYSKSNISRTKNVFGWYPKVDINSGLKKLINKS